MIQIRKTEFSPGTLRFWMLPLACLLIPAASIAAGQSLPTVAGE